MRGYGLELRRLRGARPQSAVAEALGISQQAIAAYENEQKRPSDEVKVRIADFYGVTVQSIFYPSEQPTVVNE